MESTPALLAQYAQIMAELRSRGILRSSNNPVADYAEWLACQALDLTLETGSAKGYDAKDKDGKKYQVKGRRITAANKSRQLSYIRGLDKGKPFDFLLGIVFNENFTVHRVALLRLSHEKKLAKWDAYQGAWRLMLVDGVWKTSGVLDVTEKLVEVVRRS